MGQPPSAGKIVISSAKGVKGAFHYGVSLSPWEERELSGLEVSPSPDIRKLIMKFEPTEGKLYTECTVNCGVGQQAFPRGKVCEGV